MATGAKMSFNYYQNGKYGTLPQNPQKDMEVSQDMHLKMSKKIAQLTKVIYALNTKNDEHEVVLQNVREQHEEEVQRLLAETREKITVYQAKINAESDYKRRIETLEATVREFSQQKEMAMEEFGRFKKVAEEREQALKMGHSERMLELSQGVLQAKKEFEDHLNRFRDWRQNLEKDKAEAIATLREEHEQELDKVRSHQRSHNDDWLNKCAAIEDKYKGEIERLKGELDTVHEEKNKLESDFEGKYAKAQAFYEKEMEVLRNSKSEAEHGRVRTLEEQYEKLKKDAAVQESQLRKQIDELIGRLSASEDEVEKHKMELGKLMASLKDRTSSTDALFSQLEELKKDLKASEGKLADSERSLTAHKEKCSAQQEELLKKATQIGELEATKLQQSGTIADLQTELSKMKDRLTWLESERNSLEHQRQNLSEQQTAHLKSLEQSLEDLSVEKRTMQQRLEREMENMKEKHAQQLRQLDADYSAAMSKQRSDAKALLEQSQAEAKALLLQTTQELEKTHNNKISQLTSEKDALMDEYEKAKAELMKKLTTAEEEVARLAKLVKESESGLGTASGHINSLKDASNRLKAELDKTREDLKAARVSNASLQAELDKLKLLHESRVSEYQQELKQKLDRLTKELDAKWTNTLRSEGAKLREELNQQKEDEMKAALQQLSKLKDEEIMADRAGWQQRVQDLTKQVAELTRAASNRAFEWEGERSQLQQEAERERATLLEEMRAAAEDYAHKVEMLEAVHKENITKLTEQKNLEAQEGLDQARRQHVEELSGQVSAHRAAVDSLRQQAQQDQSHALDSAALKHQKELETLREVMVEQQTQELDKQRKSHQGELHAARIELDRALEIARQKDQDHKIAVEELYGEITRREQHIENLQKEVKNLTENIARLNKEIDQKGKEILRIRSEANTQLKKIEQQLKQDHEHEIDNLSADHVHEVEGMITEFKKAQELLKDKISLLQINLEESEDKYRNRESRLEDLELIQQLRDLVQEKEQRIQELVDEKRFFQLELVNRETNFNKVFSSSPNVGVLNPLNMKKRKGDPKNVGKHHGSSNLGPHKLDPLPGSPFHDEQLNPTRPLPMPSFAKKFVK